MAVSKVKLDITEKHVTLYSTQDKVYVKLYDIVRRLSDMSMGSIVKVNRFDKEEGNPDEAYYLVIKPYDVVDLVYVNLWRSTASVVATLTLQNLKVCDTANAISNVVTMHFLEQLRKVKGYLRILNLTYANSTKCLLLFANDISWPMDDKGVYTIMYLRDGLREQHKVTLKKAWEQCIAYNTKGYKHYIMTDLTSHILFFK